MPAPRASQVDSWELAEQNAAAWMRWWGFTDAEVTPSGSDGGVDVRGSSALAQVKSEAHQVGRPALQRLVGSRPRHGQHDLLFFSSAGFSRHAVTYADEWDIALFKYGFTGSMNPCSSAAQLLLRSVEQRERAAREAEAARRRQEQEAAEAARRAEAEAEAEAVEAAQGAEAAQAARPAEREGLTRPEERPANPSSPKDVRAAKRDELARAAREDRRRKLISGAMPLEHRRSGLWGTVSFACLAFAVYSLVDGIRNDTSHWGAIAGVSAFLFVVFLGVSAVASDHNQVVDEVLRERSGRSAAKRPPEGPELRAGRAARRTAGEARPETASPSRPYSGPSPAGLGPLRVTEVRHTTATRTIPRANAEPSLRKRKR